MCVGPSPSSERKEVAQAAEATPRGHLGAAPTAGRHLKGAALRRARGETISKLPRAGGRALHAAPPAATGAPAQKEPPP